MKKAEFKELVKECYRETLKEASATTPQQDAKEYAVELIAYVFDQLRVTKLVQEWVRDYTFGKNQRLIVDLSSIIDSGIEAGLNMPKIQSQLAKKFLAAF